MDNMSSVHNLQFTLLKLKTVKEGRNTATKTCTVCMDGTHLFNVIMVYRSCVQCSKFTISGAPTA